MFTTRPTLQGTFGMVSSTHWLASQSAMAVLEDGGNAFDAAVAAGFVLHVVEPHLNGPAGEVPVILAPAGGEVRVLCGQGVAPAGAAIGHYRSLGLDLVPGTGPLAAAVPGAFDAWMVLLRDHGTRTLAQVLRYAIGYAEDGHAPVERVGQTVEQVRQLFETEWTTSADVYLPGGKAPRPGRLLRNPALAATWRRLIEEAGAGGRTEQIERARTIWREGFVAEALVRQSAVPTMDTSGTRHTGTLTRADLAGWSASYEDPVTYDWNGWTLCKAGAWSQGPAFLQQLALLPSELPAYGSADYVHLLIEGCKLAMADREAWYGDAADVPVAALLSEPYNAVRRALIEERASYDLRPGSPEGRTPALSAHATAVAAGKPGFDVMGPPAPGAGEPTVADDGATRGDTCHLDVVDRWGNMVAATPSGGWLQSNPVVPELGFPLGTRLQMAWLDPGLPNSLTPGRRPRTTLSPSLALRDGIPCMAFGTPGGDQQDQWQVHFFLAVALRDRVRGGLDLQGAVDAPGWHNDAFPGSFHPRGMRPGSVTVESRMDPEVVDGLRRRGHDITVGEAWAEGRMCVVSRDPATGIVSAAANPRGMQGYAVGR
ncbi:gamma-glutamyltransferase [Streptomyces sp. NPDC006208]|uniref:gamma-glutamyltransferase family protein n=1 Tax=Streptomyces sp. NPDC006208 TaxID=3156734 RepID=UPI0033B28F8B